MENKDYNLKSIIRFAETIKAFYDEKASELEKTGVSLVHIQILHFLTDNEGCNQQTLANYRDVKRSTISDILVQMENNDLIKRIQDNKDKRMLNIFLTDKGWDMGKYIKGKYEDYVFEKMKDFTEDDQDIFFKLIEKFIS